MHTYTHMNHGSTSPYLLLQPLDSSFVGKKQYRKSSRLTLAMPILFPSLKFARLFSLPSNNHASWNLIYVESYCNSTASERSP